MDQAQAKKIRDELKALCEKHGLWYEYQEKRKPSLKDIVLTITLKVSK